MNAPDDETPAGEFAGHRLKVEVNHNNLEVYCDECPTAFRHPAKGLSSENLIILKKAYVGKAMQQDCTGGYGGGKVFKVTE